MAYCAQQPPKGACWDHNPLITPCKDTFRPPRGTKRCESTLNITRFGHQTLFFRSLLEPHPSQTPSRTRVMVVEDVPLFQEAIKETLSLDPNIQLVYMASSGEEGLEAFPRASPDLVLLDFVLPGINGLETAKRMKEQRPYVKIAIVTAFVEDVLARVAEEADIVEVIPKSSFSLERVQQLLMD